MPSAHVLPKRVYRDIAERTKAQGERRAPATAPGVKPLVVKELDHVFAESSAERRRIRAKQYPIEAHGEGWARGTHDDRSLCVLAKANRPSIRAVSSRPA